MFLPLYVEKVIIYHGYVFPLEVSSYLRVGKTRY